MKTAEEIVLESLLEWLQQGHKAWLCTIVATVGASPRPLGSLMALSDRGEVSGSLSGGCIEDDLLQKLSKGALVENIPAVLPYGVTAEENERLGLPCGGKLEVLVEPLASSKVKALEIIISALKSRRCIGRHVDLQTGEWSIVPRNYPGPICLESTLLRQDFGPRHHLLLIGANELARCISLIATSMDYSVTVCDPRRDRIDTWGQISGVRVVTMMPDDAVRDLADDPHSFVITLTHDPRIDDMALMEALISQAAYVGALGSERTSAKRRLRLQSLDLPAGAIDRLHAPVGLPIGSKSAMEIAVAIIAELTQLRAQWRDAAKQ